MFMTDLVISLPDDVSEVDFLQVVDAGALQFAGVAPAAEDGLRDFQAVGSADEQREELGVVERLGAEVGEAVERAVLFGQAPDLGRRGEHGDLGWFHRYLRPPAAERQLERADVNNSLAGASRRPVLEGCADQLQNMIYFTGKYL